MSASGVLLFFVGVMTLAGFYAILAMILNLEAGWAGMWDLGIAGFLAVGSYVFLITTQTTHDDVLFAPALPMWAGVILASLAGGVMALVIGLPSLRVRGYYFLITTLAAAEVIRQLTINLGSLTRGTVGFNRFDRPFEGLVSAGNYRWVLLALVWIVVGLVYLLMVRLGHSPFGRLARGFRDNDAVALSLGKWTNRQRVRVFVFAGLLYGAVAPLYLWYVRSLTPALFSSDVTFLAWTVLVIGGIGSGLLAGGGKRVWKAAWDGLIAIAPAVPLLLMAASVRYIIATGGILDTILHWAATAFTGTSPFVAALMIYWLTLVLEIFITSGSAKALLLIPILMPLADLVGVNRQIAVSAYTFGDGFSNLVYPTNAALIITLSLTVVAYPKWVKWLLGLWLWVILATVAFLAVAVAIDYGPF